MTETELMFQVDASALEAVRAELSAWPGEAAATVRLQAAYVDTPGRALAGAGFAWRVRREGTRWVQTLKGRGVGTLDRLEHDVALNHRGARTPRPEAVLHAGTPAGAALQLLLARDPDGGLPSVVFATDIRRTRRLFTTPEGAVIEFALDEGLIRAGGEAADAGLPVRELELELVSGPSTALLRVAEDWALRHRLWLDVRSKAQRGDQRARGEPAGRVSLVPEIPREAALGVDGSLRRQVSRLLGSLLANAGALAAPEVEALPPHAGQVRALVQGCTKLARTLQREAKLGARGTDPHWIQALNVLAAQVERSAAAGEPLAPWLRNPGTQRLWLALLAFSEAG
jgi:inorganic triphosphatase YgiF